MKKTITKLSLLMLGLLAPLAFASCGDDDDERKPSSVVNGNGKTSSDSTSTSTGDSLRVDSTNVASGDTLIVDDNQTIEYESYWHSTADVLAVLSGSYQGCEVFEEKQLALEHDRLFNSRPDAGRKPITPTDGRIQEAFTAAYTVVNRCNTILTYAPGVKQADASMTNEVLAAIIAETRCMRAFLYYNMAMLWGDVPLLTAPDTIDSPTMPVVQSKQADVYQFAYSEMCAAVDDLPTAYSSEEQTTTRFTRNAGLMLKAEIELTLGRPQEAAETLSRVDTSLFFCFTDQLHNYLPVYTPQHLTLLQREANGDTEGLENEWAQLQNPQYGYWAALKRLGKAQEVTGCYDFELLMPFPRNEIVLNPSMHQNPGYE